MPTVVAGEEKDKVGQGDANRSGECFRKEDGVHMEHFFFFFFAVNFILRIIGMLDALLMTRMCHGSAPEFGNARFCPHCV